MYVWIVTFYEPLPLCDSRTRPQRCGMLTDALVKAGHEVRVWSSTFDHIKKSHYAEKTITSMINDSVSLTLLHACGYKKNLSLNRIVNNRQIAREFIREANNAERLPDVIFSPVPLPELAEQAVLFATSLGIPIVVDIRDPWPDVYLNAFPRWSHRWVKVFLNTEYKRMKRTLKCATGITAVSITYLEWALGLAGRSKKGQDDVFHLGFPENPTKIEGAVEEKKMALIAKYSIDVNELIVVFAGTLSISSDIKTVVQAAAFIEKNYDINLRIFIVGDGEDLAELKKNAMGFENIIFTGWFDRVSLLAMMQISSIGLAPYAVNVQQSLPNKPFEYMASGLAILSSLSGELEDMLQKTGIGKQYIAGDINSLVEQLLWFASNPILTGIMKKKSYLLFQEKYRSKIIYSSFVDYLEVISGVN